MHIVLKSVHNAAPVAECVFGMHLRHVAWIEAIEVTKCGLSCSQVFGGYVRFEACLGVSIVRQAAEANGIDCSWIQNRPEQTKLTGESSLHAQWISTVHCTCFMCIWYTHEPP